MRIPAILVLVVSLGAHFASAQSNLTSQMPTFGSMAAGADRLLQNESAFLPRESLTEPGALKGKWLSKKARESLTVSLIYASRAGAEKKDPAIFFEDEFTLTLHSATNILKRHFTAAYGSFRIYGVDVDGDGLDEIVLERGEGRGTFAYVQMLEILKVSQSHIESVFHAELNGYIYNPDADDPVSWERAYAWKKGKQNAELELELRLIPPAAVPKYCGSEATLFVLQHPKLRFRLNREQERFEIVDETFAPLGREATDHKK